jgi:hypothetical protein
MPIHRQWQHRVREEIANDIVTRKPAHRAAVLTRHDRRMDAVDRLPRNIAGGKFGCYASDLEIGVERQATEIALAVAYCRKTPFLSPHFEGDSVPRRPPA